MQTLSSGPSFCASPMKKPLLRMLWWVSVAPLGAPVVPLVNWMLIGSSNCSRPAELGQARALDARCRGPRSRRTGWCPGACAADLDHGLQQRQAGVPRAARPSSRSMAEIVAGLEAGGGDQGAAADLVQRVFQLVGAVGRVDVDQDQAGLGGGELGHHPFGVVGRPDADPVAGLEAQRQQAGGEGVDLRAAARHRSSGCPARARSAPARSRPARGRRGRNATPMVSPSSGTFEVAVHVAEPGHHGGLPFWGEPTPAGGSGQREWSARAGFRRRHGAMVQKRPCRVTRSTSQRLSPRSFRPSSDMPRVRGSSGGARARRRSPGPARRRTRRPADGEPGRRTSGCRGRRGASRLAAGPASPMVDMIEILNGNGAAPRGAPVRQTSRPSR